MKSIKQSETENVCYVAGKEDKMNFNVRIANVSYSFTAITLEANNELTQQLLY